MNHMKILSRIAAMGRVARRVTFACAVLAATHFAGVAHAQSTAPLLARSDFTYVGAFRMPADDPLGASTFNYGGRGLTPHYDAATGKLTLFMQGHSQRDGKVAQIEVPSSFVKSDNWNSLPMAKVLQDFRDVTDGRIGTAGDTYNGMPTYGMLSFNNRLIVGVAQTYGNNQVASHGVSGLNLSNTSDFKGFYSFKADAPPRALGGPMTPIPPEWRSALGGSALTGNCCLSMIGATSSGPSATVFNPDDVGVVSPIPGKTVLFYPLATPVCGSAGCEATQNNVFNLTSRVVGVGFPGGTRTVFFVGGHGTGPYCYGTSDECRDPFLPGTKGPHAQPYRYQIWAYDANDLVAVKNGSKSPSAPRPYAIWVLDDLPLHGLPVDIMGAGYDPTSGYLFIAQHYGMEPRIDVYKVNSTPRPVPNPPTGLTIQ